jgi:uridine kinase
MRVVETFGALAPRVLGLHPSAGLTRLVAVDGRAGSGKTRFAGRVAGALRSTGASVATVHTDDLASHADFYGWAPALVRDVLEPLRAGRTGVHWVYNWVARRADTRAEVPPVDVVILEGVGAGRRELTGYLAYTIWVETRRQAALARGLQRDIAEHGEALRRELMAFWDEWASAEAIFLNDQRTWQRADLLVDGDSSLPHDPEREYVCLRDGYGGVCPSGRSDQRS